MTHETYLYLRRKLISRLDGTGTRVSIRRRLYQAGVNFGVSGSYSSLRRSITVSIRGNCSYASILAVLAHEVRHAEHARDGLFIGYYNPDLETRHYRQQVRAGLVIPPPVSEGQCAENDCNRFAVEWMAQEGYPLDPTKSTYRGFFEEYPAWQVMTSHLHRLVPVLQVELDRLNLKP